MRWDPGPILRIELLTTARRTRYYVARVVYGLFLLGGLCLEYLKWRPDSSPYKMGRFAESTFLSFAAAQGLGLMALIPALVAGTIADERQRRTLPDLLASGLSANEIVLGKLAARLLHVGVFVVLGLPVVCLVGLFGGLDPWDVASVTLGTAAITFLVAAVSILVSVVAERPRRAIVTAYSFVAVWLFLPLVLARFAPLLDWPLRWVAPVNDAVLLSNPINVWGELSGELRDRLYLPEKYQGLVPRSHEAFHALLLMAWLGMSCGAICLVLAIWLLRNSLTERRRRRPWAGGWSLGLPRAPTRPGCGDDPMLWKERYAPGGRSWLSSQPVVLVLGVAAACYLFDAARPALEERFWSARGPAPYASLTALNEELRMCAMLVFVIAGLAVAGAAAASVSEEREQGTWTSLLTTLVTGREIVRAKLFGAVWGARRLFATLLGMWGVGVLTGAIHPLGFVAALASVVVFLTFAAALGLYLSLKARNTSRALITTIASLIVANLVVLIGAELSSRIGPSLPLAGSAPYIVWAAPMSPTAVAALASNEIVQAGRLHKDLTIVVLGLIVHTVAALVLVRAAIRGVRTSVETGRL